MRRYRILLFAFIISIFCIATTPNPNRAKISVLVGANQGGIVENTDMSVVPNVSTPPEAIVDAFTGATQTGFHAGVHINQPVGKNEVETGLEYMFSHHTFNYIDNGNMYIGVRRASLSQIMLPLTYNFILVRNIDLQLKLGVTFQYNLVRINDITVFNLPDYKIHHFSAGPTLGVSAFPVKFANGNKLGLYLDLYRGSQIYEDYYNQTTFEMPGSAYLKGGIKYQF